MRFPELMGADLNRRRYSLPGSFQGKLTIFTDKAFFRQSLGLPDEGDVYLVVVDRFGGVLLRSRGVYTEDKGRSLYGLLARRMGVDKSMSGISNIDLPSSSGLQPHVPSGVPTGRTER